MIWMVKQLNSTSFCMQIIKAQKCPKASIFSRMFYIYYIISTTYQKIGDLFCPVIFVDFRTVWEIGTILSTILYIHTFKSTYLLWHGSYRWIIMLAKCGHPDLNVFHIKWIIDTHSNWKKIKIPGAILELPVKQCCQSSQFTAKMGHMGWIGSAV